MGLAHPHSFLFPFFTGEMKEDDPDEIKTWKQYKKRKAEKLVEQFNTKKPKLVTPYIFSGVCAYVSTGFLAMDITQVHQFHLIH